MTRIVALPMYDPGAEALQRFWIGLRDAMRREGISDVPDELGQPDDLETHWREPDLLLSQTCGYPYAMQLADTVQLVGAPCYRAEGCEGPRYRSAIVVRANDAAESLADLRGRRAAINMLGSHSGWNVLRAMIAPLAQDGRFFGEVVATGSHHGSMRAVGGAEADMAAIDCVTLALARRDRPELASPLRVLAWSRSAPGLPFVTSHRTSPEDLAGLKSALDRVCADPALSAVRAAMLLDGWQDLPAASYSEIRDIEDEAVRMGYPTLM